MENGLNRLSHNAERARISPLKLIGADELHRMPKVKEQFLVDNLIPLGGLSLLIGKPKDGKSCLARQLAIDVAQGNDFLGMKTMQGAVIYFAFEEPMSRFNDRILAAGSRHNDPLFSYFEPLHGTPNDLLDKFEATLDGLGEVKLIVVDTLLKLTRVKDSNAYMDTQNGLEWLHNLAMRRGITVLGIHHIKKSGTSEDRSSDNMSGSNAIAGAANNILELSRQRQDQASGPRILRMNEYRYGEELQPTILSFDSETQRYSVGGTLSDSEKEADDDARHQLEQTIIAYVTKHPNCERDEIIKSIPGRSNRTREVFYSLVNGEPPILERTGGGKRGDPFKYFLAEIQEESAA
jgi:hypothetical protein